MIDEKMNPVHSPGGPGGPGGEPGFGGPPSVSYVEKKTETDWILT